MTLGFFYLVWIAVELVAWYREEAVNFEVASSSLAGGAMEK